MPRVTVGFNTTKINLIEATTFHHPRTESQPSNSKLDPMTSHLAQQTTSAGSMGSASLMKVAFY
jgi:hypothetical protein